MKPLKLLLAGFRSFRAEQTLDFAGLDLFAIVGDTGAGKSSILEAIVYALYNKSTFSERDVKQLIALDADTMRVDLEFEAGGARYTVIRSASRPAGRPSVHALRRPSQPDYRFDGEQAVNEEIRRITGLEYATFIKTVVLPQGRFADLLTAADSERIRVLGELLGLDEIDRIRETLESPYQRAREVAAGLRASLETFGPDPAAQVESARRDHAVAEQDLERFSHLKSVATKTIQAVEQSRRGSASFETTLSTLAVATQHCGRVEALGTSAAELNAMRAAAQLGREKAEAERHAAQEEEKKLRESSADLIALTRFRGVLDRLSETRETLGELETRLRSEERELREREADLERRRIDQQRVIERKEQADERVATAQIVAAQAGMREATGRDAYRALVSAEARSSDATASLETVRDARQIAQSQLDLTAAAAREVASVADVAHAAYEEVRRAGLAAIVAHEVCGGDPCPVCRQTVPADFVPAVAPDLSEYKQHIDGADARCRKAEAELARRGERLEASERTIEESAAAHSRAVAEHERACGHALACGIELPAADEAQAVAALSKTAVRATNAYDEHRQALEDLAAAIAREAGSISTLAAGVDREKKRHGTNEAGATTLRQRIESERASLPDRLRPSHDASTKELQRCSQALEQSESVARTCADRAERASVDARVAEATFSASEQRWRTEIESVAIAALAGADHTLRGLPITGEAASDEPIPARLRSEIEHAIAWAFTVRSWSDRYRTILETKHAEAIEALDTAERQLAEQLAEAKCGDSDELDRSLRDSTAVTELSRYKLERAEANLVEARNRQERLATVDPLSRALEHLRRYLESNKFKDYLMHLRERRLLGIATEILRKMTADRYAFAEGFQILDGLAQQTRDPRTLSGGEKFLASLALALGLVEVTAQAGGRLDALFLDEGFGSLDATFLDVALGELAHRASSGKMIGVITHVRGIAAEIETVLRVQHLAGGSTITRLSGGEREGLLDDTLTSGLLEAAR